MRGTRRFLCLAAAIALAGCGGGLRHQNTLVYGRGGDADSLDPVMTSSGESVKVLVNVFDTLVTYDDETLDLVPALAERWETSDDGLVWTFHLRRGVKFHDGTTFDSGAVKFHFDRLLDRGVGYREHYTMIESVEAPAPLVAVFHLRRPSPVFLKNLAMFPAGIASPAAVQRDESGFAQHPIGTGPFRFESWIPKQKLALAAFDQHWRGRPAIGRVIFLPVDESAVRVMALTRGDIDIADNLPPSEIDTLARHSAVEIQHTEGINVGYLSINLEKPPLDSLKVRRAIANAIDKERLCQVTYSGHARPATTLVPPALWGHHGGLAPREHDIALARRLLREAAEEEGFSLPLRLTLFQMQQPRPYMQQPRQTALRIRDSLEEIGIAVNVQSIDLRQYWQRLSRGEHDLALAGWSSDNNDPDNFLYSLLHSDNIDDAGGNNLSRYRSAEFDRLVTAAQMETGEDERRRLYEQAQEIAYSDVPLIPLVHTEVRIAQRKEVAGYLLHPSSLVRLRKSYFAGGTR